jgi:hypothetical protein
METNLLRIGFLIENRRSTFSETQTANSIVDRRKNNALGSGEEPKVLRAQSVELCNLALGQRQVKVNPSQRGVRFRPSYRYRFSSGTSSFD